MTDDVDPVLPSVPDDDFSRRLFVKQLSFMGGGLVLVGSACSDKKPEPTPPKAAPLNTAPVETTKHLTFTNAEFAIISAAVNRLLPKDEDPGALEANVPEFIDRILQTPQLSQMKEQLMPGINALNRRCQRLHKVDFTAATPAQQDEVLTVFKNSPDRSGESKFYEYLLVLTLEGFLGDPSYGGNKNRVGWSLVGFSLVDHTAADPLPSFDGLKALKDLKCGGGKGC